jgi:hypothetical protein
MTSNWIRAVNCSSLYTHTRATRREGKRRKTFSPAHGEENSADFSASILFLLIRWDSTQVSSTNPRVERQKEFASRHASLRFTGLFGFFRSSIVENENATEKGMSKRKIVENIFTSTEPRASSCRLRAGLPARRVVFSRQRSLCMFRSSKQPRVLCSRSLSVCVLFYAYLINLVSPMLSIVLALASLSPFRCIPKLNARIGRV